jgi:glycerol-3-phosphate dehydrogenase
VLKLLGKPRFVSTVDMPIGGGRNYPHDENSRNSMVNKIGARGEELLNRYGTKAFAVQDFATTTQDHPLPSLPGYSSGEIAYICAHENVRHLADLLLRRTAITMEGLLTQEAIHDTAKIAADVLGWSQTRCKAEIEHAKSELELRNVKNVRSETALH